MELGHLAITDGYIGAFGLTWKTPTADELEAAIQGAMQIENMTRDQVMATLEQGGKTLRWRQSPNYYYDHSWGKIGRRRTAPPSTMVRCDCGHSVPFGMVMSASFGTTCPDCYDRMSG